MATYGHGRWNTDSADRAGLKKPVDRNPVCHYIVVRSDLPRGVQAAQIVHAAGESVDRRVEEGTFAVVLTVPDERALVRLADQLRQSGVAFTAIFEPDEPHLGAMMALGLAPGRKEAIKRHLSALPLLK
jgi:peptidyl-tRNA hydrolase